ncbi:MAG TPA: carboxypeptidase regulatory-like domain-containing protein [Candidatus Sulfopaludibacter sp.]|jgi:hypothetical protein|nr:carboxypeptidase regulatory-like domain-containing protein [Candidatus Sulfopaludibacter sp.]
MAKLWMALVLCQSAAAQSVDGTVVNTVTNIGIPGLKVNVAQGTTFHSVTTDSQGKFHLDDLKEGTWIVRSETTSYGFRPARFAIANGTPATVELKLTPQPKISGHVVDGKGVPVPKATIRLLSPIYSYTGAADADGKFDIHDNLPPGEYLLSATAPQGLKPPDSEKDVGRILAWARTYYPASLLPEGAAKIPLKAGAEVLDLEVKLMAVAAHSIRGVCLNPDGSPVANIKITLGEGRPYPIVQTVTSNAEGAWEFPAVTDGEWNLATKSGELQASQWIDMTGHDLERLALRLSAPFAVTAKIEAEAPQGMPVPRMPSIALAPHVARTGLEGALIAQGMVRMDKLYPGLYSISAPLPPQPFYLDSLRVDGAEITTREVEFSGPATITVGYKLNGGAVRGTVEGCTEGSVWLVPQEPARRFAFFRFAPCLNAGRYEVAATRPGEYYALAVAGEFPRPWIFGIFDQALLDRATRVTVRAGETTAADLRLY